MTLNEEELEQDLYTVDIKDNSCKHHFRRVKAGIVECTRCHFGLYADTHFPLEEINKHYT